MSTLAQRGVYTVRLPVRVEDDIHAAFIQQGGNPDDLPKLPKYSGGEVNFMIGIQYLRYHPKRIFQMPSGLTI